MNNQPEEINTSDYSLVAKLQTKKNKLRTLLNEKGILIKGARNSFDDYEYFSEGQYKELFTELFSKCGIEFDSNEKRIEFIEGTEKQKFGILVSIDFILTDKDTGFSMSYTHSGIAFDKGDKALYKAKTGALKYFLATTFLVATKDDPERDENDKKLNKGATKVERKTNNSLTISDNQKALIKRMFENDLTELTKQLHTYGKKKINELSITEASEIIKSKKEGSK